MREKHSTEAGETNGGSIPLEAEYARLHRVLQIIQLIQQQDGWNAKALARACGVTQRTIYRDLTLLQGANIPFFFDEERRSYRIRQDFFMPPIELSLDEALALVALGEEIGKKEQIPFTMAAARAVAKIRGQLPESLSFQRAWRWCILVSLRDLRLSAARGRTMSLPNTRRLFSRRFHEICTQNGLPEECPRRERHLELGATFLRQHYQSQVARSAS